MVLAGASLGVWRDFRPVLYNSGDGLWTCCPPHSNSRNADHVRPCAQSSGRGSLRPPGRRWARSSHGDPRREYRPQSDAFQDGAPRPATCDAGDRRCGARASRDLPFSPRRSLRPLQSRSARSGVPRGRLSDLVTWSARMDLPSISTG